MNMYAPRHAVLAISLAAAIAGCSQSPGDSSASTGSALAETVDDGAIRIYEQAPFSVELGQGVAAARVGDEWTGPPPTLLASKCVAGQVRSTLDVMHDTGRSGLGATVSALYGSTDGTPAMATAPFVVERMMISDAAWPEDGRPRLTLEEVKRFNVEAVASSSRVSGVAGILVSRNYFTLRHEQRVNSPSECGSLYVRGLLAKRFLSYAIRIDFPVSGDAEIFRARWIAGVNELLLPTPKVEVTRFLAEHQAAVSAHVLVASGLAPHVKAAIANDRCDVGHLQGCASMNAHLAAILADLPALPGTDDFLESVLAPDASWGAFGVELSDYTHVP